MSTSINRTPAKHVNKLKMIDSFKLRDYVNANYVASGLLDTQFAVKAGADLGVTLTAANIHGIREALGLQSNRDKQREENKSPTSRLEALLAKVNEQEVLLADLSNKLNKLATRLGEQL